MQHNAYAPSTTNSLAVCFTFHTDTICHSKQLGAAISCRYFVTQIIFPIVWAISSFIQLQFSLCFFLLLVLKSADLQTALFFLFPFSSLTNDLLK